MSQDTLKERGKRLKLLVSMSGLDVIEFAKITQIGTSTLRNWIKGRASGLSEKGAKKICQFSSTKQYPMRSKLVSASLTPLLPYNPTRVVAGKIKLHNLSRIILHI